MSDDQLKPAPLAYENEAFLDGPDGRGLRILSEYLEPITRFRKEQIQDTVVFFGSARVKSPESANEQLTVVNGNHHEHSTAQQQKEKQALAAVDM